MVLVHRDQWDGTQSANCGDGGQVGPCLLCRQRTALPTELVILGKRFARPCSNSSHKSERVQPLSTARLAALHVITWLQVSGSKENNDRLTSNVWYWLERPFAGRRTGSSMSTQTLNRPPRMPLSWVHVASFSAVSRITRVPGPAPRLQRFSRTDLKTGPRLQFAFPVGEPLSGCANSVEVHGSVLKFLLQTSVASCRQGSNRDTLEGEARAKRSWLPIPPAAGRVGDARFLPFRAVESAPTAWGAQNPV